MGDMLKRLLRSSSPLPVVRRTNPGRRQPITLLRNSIISRYISSRILAMELMKLEDHFSKHPPQTIVQLQEEIVLLYAIHFHRAAKWGDLRKMKSILEEVKTKIDSFQSSVTVTSAAASLVFQSLIEHHDSLDGQRTALIQSAAKGYLESVKLLILQFNADLFAKDGEHGSMAIHLAAQNGHLQVIEFLLSHQPRLLEMRDKYGNTTLHTAALFDHLPIAEFLIKGMQAYVEPRNNNGATPLILAAQKGHVKIVKLLVKHGADVNVKETSTMGDTAIHAAAAYGHTQVVQFLLECDPSLRLIRNDAGLNAHSYAMLANQWAVVRFLESIEMK